MKNELKKPNIERLLTVMKGGIADRVPNYEILLEARNVKALLGRDRNCSRCWKGFESPRLQ